MVYSLLDAPFWLANLLLASMVFVYILWKKTIIHVMVGLFVYLTLHHSYGLLPLFPGIPQSWMNALHLDHGIYPQAIGLPLLLFSIIWIAWRAYSHHLPVICYRASYLVVLIAVIWGMLGMTVLVGQLLANHSMPSMLSIKDYLSAVMMLLFAVVVGFGLKAEFDSTSIAEIPFRFLLAVVFLVVSIGAYEVLSEQAWSGQYLGDNIRSYRASSVLFNPNVLGIWTALLALGSCYLWLAMPNHLGISLLFTSSSVVGLFLSGSRSALLLYYASMAIFGVLLGIKRLQLKRFLISITVFSLLFVVVVVGCYQYSYEQRGHPLRLLSDRFVVLVGITDGSTVTDTEAAVHNSETVYSGVTKGITGRMGGKTSDNGYLAIKEGLGLGPMLVWVGLFMVAIVTGLRSYSRRTSLFGAFAITCLLAAAMMGMIIRSYQVFPVWGFNAIFMGIFLFWLLRSSEEITV